MTIVDYIYSKMKEEERQFIGVIHCLKIFGGFPLDMNKKSQNKFVKKHSQYSKEQYNIEFIGFKKVQKEMKLKIKIKNIKAKELDEMIKFFNKTTYEKEIWIEV